MANYFTDNPDLLFHFEKNTDWEAFVPGIEKGFTDEGGFGSTAEAVEVYRDLLTQIGELAAEEIAPTAKSLDKSGVGFADGEVVIPEGLLESVRKLAAIGIVAPQVGRSLGGANLPMTVTAMMLEMLSRADLSTMIQFAFYSETAAMIERFGSEAQQQQWIPRIAAGEISGSIAITEPQAGSDVGAVKTRAELGGDGWRVFGQKQFITNGSSEVCLALTRTDPNSTGLDGLSIMLIPRKKPDGRANFVVAKSESKLCIRASATCGLSFDGSAAELLGREPGHGFEQMLTFMNEARIAVAVQALGLAEAARAAARSYAEQRVQMGRPIARHELVSELLDRMEDEIRGMRSLVYAAARISDRITALEFRLPSLTGGEKAATARELKALGRKLRALVPLAKYGAPERTCRITRDALQVHGGYGITTEYDAERYYRDSTILAIYEGTSQIQALMALKDQLRWAGEKPLALAAEWLGAKLRSGFALDADRRRAARVDAARAGAGLAILGSVRKRLALSDHPGSAKEKLVGDAGITAPARRVAEHYIRLLYLDAEARLLESEAVRFPEREAAWAAYVRRAAPEATEARERLAQGLAKESSATTSE